MCRYRERMKACGQRGNDLAVLRWIGRIGFIPEAHRKKAFAFSAMLCVASLGLALVSGVSFVDMDYVSRFPWSVSEDGVFESVEFDGTTQFYVGLQGIQMQVNLTCKPGNCLAPLEKTGFCPGFAVSAASFSKSGLFTLPSSANQDSMLCFFSSGTTLSNTFTQSFNDVDCASGLNATGGADYCTGCTVACYTAFGSVLSTLIFIPLSLAADWHRSDAAKDSNCEKLAGIKANLIGGCLALFGLYSFFSYCGRDLPTRFSFQGTSFELSYSPGHGLILLVLATVCLILDGCVHLCVRTGQGGRQPSGTDEECTALKQEPVSLYGSATTA